MELNTAGQEEHALSLEILWLPVLMSTKCQVKLGHSQVRHALAYITTWYLFLKENSTMWYCMLDQMMLLIIKERKFLTNCWSWIIYCRKVTNNTYSNISSNHENDSKHLAMKIDVMYAWIFETLSVKMCANHLPEGFHVF